MYKLRIKPQWMVSDGATREQLLQPVLELLTAVHEQGNLAKACRATDMSYRHAWGMVRQAGETLGAPLLHSTRGQGAKLTALGQKLVWANHRIGARLWPLLDSLTSELEAEIQGTLADSKPVTRIHASHAFALAALRPFMAQRSIPVDIKYRGSAEALASLCQGDCDMAGFHVPVGDFQAEALHYYRDVLRPRSHTLINVVTRRQGIIVAAGNPKKILAIRDLVRPGIRYVNRHTASGTRLLLDLMLKRENIEGRQIAGFDSAEFTHAAVAAYIASGMADAGLGVETAAREFRLGFVPLLHERYFIAYDSESSQNSSAIGQIIDIMRSSEFKAHINEIPGLDATLCGSLISIEEAFPSMVEPGSLAAAAAPSVARAKKGRHQERELGRAPAG